MPEPALLIAVAAPAEARSVARAHLGPAAEAPRPWEAMPLGPRRLLLATGVGKANAAAAVARLLAQPPAPIAAVLNAGVAGLLPGTSGLDLGSAIAAERSLFADEGLQTPDRFLTCAEMGFPPAPPPFEGPGLSAHPILLNWMRHAADSVADIATVSTCSGTDALARLVRSRTGAAAEAMEGAAIAQVCAHLGVPFAELRVISNTTGDRPRQRWDLPGALSRLGEVLGRLPPPPTTLGA